MSELLNSILNKIFDVGMFAVPAGSFFVVDILPLPSMINLMLTYLLMVYITTLYIKRVVCKKDTDNDIWLHAIKATSMYLPFIIIGILSEKLTFLYPIDFIANNWIVWLLVGYKYWKDYMNKMISCNIK